jgi:glycosyltransferase involved in cell wall biosynthesis
MSSTGRLLFVSPVMPAAAGNGLAMRAGLFLDALSRAFRVDLLVVPAADPDCGEFPGRFARDRTERARIRPLGAALDPHFARAAALPDADRRSAAIEAYPRPLLTRFATARGVTRAIAMLGDRSYDAVHVFRLYLAPYVEPFLDRRPRPATFIDLDEVESASSRRLATLFELGADAARARRAEAEAEKYAAMEREWLPRFDRVVCSSSVELVGLDGRVEPSARAAVPNAVDTPLRPVAVDRPVGDRFLFVGSMFYPPNADAAAFFCADVWPGLRNALGPTARFSIVGSHPSEELRRRCRQAGAEVTGRVEDIAPFYAAADIAVAPIRAGGGTRIKILEAFAHGLPVVATAPGAAGLEVTHGEDIWLADTAEDFIAGCLRLARDAALRRRLAEGGQRLLRRSHDAAAVKDQIVDLYGGAVDAAAFARGRR